VKAQHIRGERPVKTLTKNDDLLALAKRVVWFETPKDAIDDPEQLVLHTLQFGTHEDVSVLMRHVSLNEIAEVLANARPGILDERSWSYWHVKTGTYPPPPMPERSFEHGAR